MKILIVDDEVLVRKSLGRAFQAKGHQVVDASDGSEGLQKWLSFQPDLVLLDILMPGLSGPELLQEILAKNELHNAKVVFISAYAGEHNVQTAQNIGADLFIPKPFDDIFAVVEKAEALMANR